jgi:hypothetical protein
MTLVSLPLLTMQAAYSSRRYRMAIADGRNSTSEGTDHWSRKGCGTTKQSTLMRIVPSLSSESDYEPNSPHQKIMETVTVRFFVHLLPPFLSPSSRSTGPVTLPITAILNFRSEFAEVQRL